MFEKVFVADNLAKIVDPVFAGVGHYNGVMVLLALYAFSFQIFCDFAGYSNMARGLGKIMGFDIMVNFNLPYFATNPREFWQRWHISLSTWLRDYLYIPLGGNRKSTFITYCNLAITMFLGGLWHGAAWTFVVWGIYQGLLLIIHRAFTPFLAGIASPRNAFIEKSWFIVRVIFFFHLICLGWLFFRAQSITQAFQMLHSLLFNFTFTRHLGLLSSLGGIFWAICFLLFIQIFQFAKKDLLVVFRWNWFLQGVTYFIILFFLATFGAGVGKEFIYFQF
jgi:D-alanyl-lipoteichoic acid acyltransferase DltB (MBOAT superfamily)